MCFVGGDRFPTEMDEETRDFMGMPHGLSPLAGDLALPSDMMAMGAPAVGDDAPSNMCRSEKTTVTVEENIDGTEKTISKTTEKTMEFRAEYGNDSVTAEPMVCAYQNLLIRFRVISLFW